MLIALDSEAIVLPFLPMISIPKLLLYLIGNTLTQYICISAVFILTTECASLTVTLVVTLRKVRIIKKWQGLTLGGTFLSSSNYSFYCLSYFALVWIAIVLDMVFPQSLYHVSLAWNNTCIFWDTSVFLKERCR